MRRPSNCYRGKRKWAPFITAVLLLLAFLLIAFIFCFYYFQRFAVYDDNGVHLDFSGASSQSVEVVETPEPTEKPQVSAEIVVDESDFSEIDFGAGESAEPVQLMHVSGSYVTEENLSYYATLLSAQNENGMLVQLNSGSGMFNYESAIEIASGYGLNGSGSIGSAVGDISIDGNWMAAEISTLTNTALAERYPSIALHTADGSTAVMGDQKFLDPYSAETRSYVISIMQEAQSLGFKEVVLTGLYLPDSEDLTYNSSMTSPPDKSTAVSAFAVAMRKEAEDLGLTISVVIDTDYLRNGSSSAIGQDLEAFSSIFDRIYFSTDSGHVSSDMEKLSAYVSGSNASARLVPMSSSVLSDCESFCRER